MSRGSLHAMPVKLTPNGCGLRVETRRETAASGAFGTMPNGTITVG